jgi:uncharacterized protein (DUF697 family)/tellurite resistance protein
MNPAQQKSILTIALLAAFADGNKHDRERDQIGRLAESLSHQGDAPDLSSLYQDVLLKRVSLADACEALDDPDHRQLAYEMAVCVCDADGAQSDAERRFLVELKTRLGLDATQTAVVEREAGALANEPLVALPAVQMSAAAKPGVREAELDQSILNYSILNGALELLPQSWASMAIIPIQIKMVYRIGGAYGHTLDKSHIKEFLATVGVGLTSQYLEQIGRKLLGGLLGKVAGKTVGGIGRAATGAAFSFATTYALGQIAKRYYAGGRQMSTTVLKESFSNLLGSAKQLQTQYASQIQQKSSTIDAGQILALVRGS